MKRLNQLFTCAMSLVLLQYGQLLHAEEMGNLISKAKLIFEDDFNRKENDESKEELGKAWSTNSQRRAKGHKQVDLVDGVMRITMSKAADHGVSVKHDAPFDDGMVKVRFRMLSTKGLKFNFNDPKASKLAHAGHVCNVEVSAKGVKINDHLTGVFEKTFSLNKKAGKLSKAEQAAHLKGKFKNFKQKLNQEKWYELGILIQGDQLTVFLDGEKIGAHQSPGYDHKVKQNLAFAVSSQCEVDDLKIWSLD